MSATLQLSLLLNRCRSGVARGSRPVISCPTGRETRATQPPGGERWIGRLLSSLCFCLGVWTAFGAEAPISREYQIKAAFLYNFTKFVEWPPQRFDPDDRPIVIGVLGGNPFGNELVNTLRDRKVNGRAFVIKAIGIASEATAVDLLFVPTGEEPRLAGALAAINGAGVLTVGESEQFAALGGAITFTVNADKIRFEINRGASQQAGLKISAQLLKLASAVRTEP